MSLQLEYYETQVQFETVNDNSGRIQKTKEKYLVEANSCSDAEEKMKNKFRDSMADFSVLEVKKSKIMGIVK